MISKMLISFVLAQLLLVILSTFKSVFMINGGKISAATFNAAAYSLNNLIVVMIAAHDPTVVVAVTMITNFIGVYLALHMLERFKKDKLWYIVATTENELVSDYVEQEMLRNEVSFNRIACQDGRSVYNIFSQTRDESQRIKEIIKENNIKYSVIETIAGL